MHDKVHLFQVSLNSMCVRAQKELILLHPDTTKEPTNTVSDYLPHPCQACNHSDPLPPGSVVSYIGDCPYFHPFPVKSD